MLAEFMRSPIVLVADRDAEELTRVCRMLRQAHFDVQKATSAQEMYQAWRLLRPQVVVLDRGLQGCDAYDACVTLTSRGTYVMMSGEYSAAEILGAMRAGAADYVSRPYIAVELLARLQDLTRAMQEGRRRVFGYPSVLAIGPLTLNQDSHEVYVNGEQVHVTPIEFRLLFILAGNAGNVVSTIQLMEIAWGYQATHAALLKSHIASLRRKLNLPRRGPGSITAERRVGYRFANFSTPGPGVCNSDGYSRPRENASV